MTLLEELMQDPEFARLYAEEDVITMRAANAGGADVACWLDFWGGRSLLVACLAFSMLVDAAAPPAPLAYAQCIHVWAASVARWS